MNYADNTYHFRQDSSFLYFIGLDAPSLAAIIDFDNGTTTIFGDDLTVDMIVWMGSGGPALKARALTAGIDKTAPVAALAPALAGAAKQGRHIHFLPPYRPENKLKLFELLRIDPAQVSAKASRDLITAAADLRNVKSSDEIAEIDKAATISADMHRAAMRMVRPGQTEAAVAAEVTRIAQASGGQLSFPVIATINGQTLHNHYHGNVLESGRLFILDAGAETDMHYAGDLTSTMPVDKKFTARQRDVYNLCFAAHLKAASLLKPGVKNKDVHLAACTVIAQGMKDAGLMKGSIDDAVAEGAHALFMPHGIGHLMGLDVHDMEDLGEAIVGYGGESKSTQFGLRSLRLGRELQPGFVLTVEPGIYFIPELIDLWKKENRHCGFINYDLLEPWRDFGGVRIEDDYLITADGARMLGRKIPRTVEEIEAERADIF